MNPVVLAASLVAVLALAAAAWALGLGRGGRIGAPEEAADAAEAALAGFAAENAVLGADGQGALVVAADGRVAVAKRHGARVAVREVGWGAVRSTADGVVVETGERLFGRVALAGVDALDVRRLAPAGMAKPLTRV